MGNSSKILMDELLTEFTGVVEPVLLFRTLLNCADTYLF